MKGVFKCAREDDEKIQECQTLKLGDAPVHPQEIFKETQASKLGDAPCIPFSINIISSSFVPLYFYHFMCYVLCLERLDFSFPFSFLQLLITSRKSAFFMWERNTLHFYLEHNIEFSCLSLLCVFFVF